MENNYYTWDDFVNGFGKEMVSAEDVYKRMKKSGLVDFSMIVFDYHFVSDSKEKLEKLNDFLLTHYPYKFEKYIQHKDCFELHGTTDSMPITKDNLLYWGLDMAKRGYEFDCRLDGYGGAIDLEPKLPDFDKSKEDYYFNKAIECYNSGNLSGAIANWTIVLEINDKDPNSYYSRAIVKNELYTWKSALQDYDKAIELAPDFDDALVNRGSVKDENGDYDGAIVDYNKAIEINPENGMAYFNRGNSKFNKGDQNGACLDWKKALELGEHYAKERIEKHCE
ncbi:tetratricopeptide repeat protein [Marinifilum caeruleilacunae]|uniref:Tetratricopeptide repeat protein n=1 Tax=Marinifilum caeruleilacunae TaxID=2499076 RepID=A0ABX1WU37_9BACT|nr:tetratricopeptide repeat protein [Marinifilum caeruleilacunae]NOU59620.1 tetratricopeptide repeat protein [Marinifilum caeruleilacunae]